MADLKSNIVFADRGKPLHKKHDLLAAKIGIQWPRLAGALGLSSDDIWKIQMDFDGSEPGQQSSAMIATWSSRFADAIEDKGKLIVMHCIMLKRSLNQSFIFDTFDLVVTCFKIAHKCMKSYFQLVTARLS